ncbi:actin-like protein, putative (ALP2a) [Plasmodium ovale wallikeri]|uniref:Actin-like protein, putative (ALP2a) n=1 Tax=Plasmodium ovale wallikeri TaxID=864142 RepID=A0A1A8YTD7_PLAOA|nr:actin-like protein, putative (ALP2a) [Plasmodium ovale wallikeri]SBT35229.1 actin-like protein, putative (ALP2a) [Plasmodium ovale wallikeri]
MLITTRRLRNGVNKSIVVKSDHDRGNNIQTIILDVNDGEMRAGYSGECSPRYKSNLILGLPLGHNATLKHTIFPLLPETKRDNVELLYGMKYVYNDNNNSRYDINFEVMEKLFEDISGSKALDVNFQDHPILLTEPNKTDSKYREKFTELMFESYNVYQLFLSRRSVLSCYGCARTSGLVLNVEKNCTNLCGIYEGYIFQKHIEEVPIGGELIDRIYLSYLENTKNIKIYPYFSIDKTSNTEKRNNDIKILKCPLVTKSYYLWGSLHVINQMKENLINDYQHPNDKKKKDTNVTDGNNNYKLPDGNIIDQHTSETLKLIFPYIFFRKKYNQNSISKINGITTLNDINFNLFYDMLRKLKLPVLLKYNYKINNTNSIIEKIIDNTNEKSSNICYADQIETYFEIFDGLQDFIKKGILSFISANIHLDEVLNFLIVTGESTMFHNFVGILKSYLPFIDTIKEKSTKIIYSKGADRRCNCFIGASILSSLGSFPQFCMTKSEYEEFGVKNIVDKNELIESGIYPHPPNCSKGKSLPANFTIAMDIPPFIPTPCTPKHAQV